jgi:type IV secretion system protein VirB3
MSERNSGLIADPLFVGATRPSMVWGVTYSAVMINAMCMMELFLLTKNLLILLLAAPVHGVCMLLCVRDARFFDLALIWGRTRLPAFLANLRFWKASSYSPLILDVPDARGRRRARACARVTDRALAHRLPTSALISLSAKNRDSDLIEERLQLRAPK